MVSEKEKPEKINQEKMNCGIVMPISECDGCLASHWDDVKKIIIESVNSIQEYSPKINLVSETGETNIIQKNIVQNLYKMDIIICDISGRNSNVMFEMGMRLAFDKPIVIIKDDKTLPPFDTSIIEYIEYSRDLHYLEIQSFKDRLASKISNTYTKARDDPEYSIFLQSFGDFKVPIFEEKKVESNELILDSLRNIENRMNIFSDQLKHNPYLRYGVVEYDESKFRVAKEFLDVYYRRDPTIVFDDNLLFDDKFLGEALDYCWKSGIFDKKEDAVNHIVAAARNFIYG